MSEESKTTPATVKDSSYYDSKGIKYAEDWFTNSRGMKLKTASWTPASTPPKALVLLCHGYAVDCLTFHAPTAERLAAAGYQVYGIDYEGHGGSEGVRCFVPKFQTIIDDCTDFIATKTGLPENQALPRFLIGQSMGGAVSLLIHRKEPALWSGAVLVAPMVKLPDASRPPFPVEWVLRRLVGLLPQAPIVPTHDVMAVSTRDKEKLKRFKADPILYKGKPRLATALTLLDVTLDLQKRLDEVTLPFLVLHGDKDVTTDPETSKLLHEQARSTDKEIKIYPDLWHDLLQGELDENIDMVMKDIIAWLDARATGKAT